MAIIDVRNLVKKFGDVTAVDDAGQVVVRSPFRDVGGVHWVEDPVAGDRLAIVTGRNAARSVVKGQAFVDFRVLPTAQGLVIAPAAEDVARLHERGVVCRMVGVPEGEGGRRTSIAADP